MKANSEAADLYRMVTEQHICPFGLKSSDLLEREGFSVNDHRLTTRAETDAFMAKHRVETTPQTFIGGERIGGYDDLLRYFQESFRNPKAVTYRLTVEPIAPFRGRGFMAAVHL